MSIKNSGPFGLIRRVVYEAAEPHWHQKVPTGKSEADHLVDGINHVDDGDNLRALHHAFEKFDPEERQVLEAKLQKPNEVKINFAYAAGSQAA